MLTNPYLDPAEIASFARDMPELAYRQEVLAQFLEDVGSVFRGVDRIVKGRLSIILQREKQYVMGADLAKLEDFTALSVLDMQGQLVRFR